MKKHHLLALGPHGFHKVAYVEWGAADNARVVICVHGLTRNGRDFDHLARALEADYRVVCPDVVGRGESDWLEHKADYNYVQYVADMSALIARLGVDSIDWIGTSMGGLIGMMLAAQARSPIRRLVMNDVGPYVPKAALERIATYVGKAPLFADIDSVEQYLRLVLAGFGRLSDMQWRHLAEHSHRHVGEGKLALHYDPGIAQAFSGAPLQDVDLWSVWQAVKCPTLVIRGAQSDLLLRETAERMRASRPGVELAEIADAGHAPALMDAQQAKLVRDFLLKI